MKIAVYILLFIFSTGVSMGIAQQSDAHIPALIDMSRQIKVRYTNWRGESGTRVIVPIELFWGKTEYHPQEQWLLKVWDIDRADYRDYALTDITEWL